jgi:hypothetical protein
MNGHRPQLILVYQKQVAEPTLNFLWCVLVKIYAALNSQQETPHCSVLCLITVGQKRSECLQLTSRKNICTVIHGNELFCRLSFSSFSRDKSHTHSDPVKMPAIVACWLFVQHAMNNALNLSPPHSEELTYIPDQIIQ